jgi:phosphate starvation-inducible protein PhoH
MRGRTDHAFVILDEAQNTTFSNENVPDRMGKNAKFMVTGDQDKLICKKNHFRS